MAVKYDNIITGSKGIPNEGSSDV
ncbi:uncharacterized protein METZ01_LOCUS278381, partial [marine metagenome]